MESTIQGIASLIAWGVRKRSGYLWASASQGACGCIRNDSKGSEKGSWGSDSLNAKPYYPI